MGDCPPLKKDSNNQKPLSPSSLTLCLAFCYFTCRVLHWKAVFTFICRRGEATVFNLNLSFRSGCSKQVFVTSQLVWKPFMVQYFFFLSGCLLLKHSIFVMIHEMNLLNLLSLCIFAHTRPSSPELKNIQLVQP